MAALFTDMEVLNFLIGIMDTEDIGGPRDLFSYVHSKSGLSIWELKLRGKSIPKEVRRWTDLICYVMSCKFGLTQLDISGQLGYKSGTIVPKIVSRVNQKLLEYGLARPADVVEVSAGTIGDLERKLSELGVEVMKVEYIALVKYRIPAGREFKEEPAEIEEPAERVVGSA